MVRLQLFGWCCFLAPFSFVSGAAPCGLSLSSLVGVVLRFPPDGSVFSCLLLGGTLAPLSFWNGALLLFLFLVWWCSVLSLFEWCCLWVVLLSLLLEGCGAFFTSIEWRCIHRLPILQVGATVSCYLMTKSN